jgi:nitrite reductase/ring-hydroxylating ferredoxin subunit
MTNKNEETTQEQTTSRPSALTSRRQFIQLGAVALGAAWVGTVVQSRLFPQGSTGEANPVRFPLSELPVGGIKYATYGEVPLIIMRTSESIKAFSLICTHLGCTVDWNQGEQQFYCPCHDGYFDQFGEVIAGPPPVPLEQYPVAVEEDTVIVGELV